VIRSSYERSESEGKRYPAGGAGAALLQTPGFSGRVREAMCQEYSGSSCKLPAGGGWDCGGHCQSANQPRLGKLATPSPATVPALQLYSLLAPAPDSRLQLHAGMCRQAKSEACLG
jgi:hypothetical protein